VKFRSGLFSRLSSGWLVLQPADFSTPFFWRGKHNFPLPTLVLWTRCLPFSGSALRPRGSYPPWNSRLICFTNPSKSAYSSARSPLRGTMPARLRMTSCLPFSGSALRPRGTYPPWNSRLICFTNPSKSAYSSARSPPRGTMPARLRMTSEPACLKV